jgi:ribosomal protein S18 acetylase RimI-like enzyme
MEIKPLPYFSASQLTSLLTAEQDAWARYLKWDYRSVLEIIHRTLENRSLPGFAALVEGTPAGYSYYWLLGEIGFVGGCFVDPGYAGMGVEEELLGEVLQSLEGMPGTRRVEAQFMSFQTWGAEPFFQGHAYSYYPRFFMLCEELPETCPSPDGFQVRKWENRDLGAAALVTLEAYEALIDRQISAHYQTESRCHDFLSDIILRPGCGNCLTEASFCAWDNQGQMMGYVLSSMISPRNGHIPQITVSPQYQGRGVGKILLTTAMSTMKRLQYRTVSLSVTAANLKAVNFYQKMHFRVIKPFAAFVKELKK